MSRFTPHEIARLRWILLGFSAAWLLAALLALYLPFQTSHIRFYQSLHINSPRLCVVLGGVIFLLAWTRVEEMRRCRNVVLALSFLVVACFDYLYLTHLPGLHPLLPRVNQNDALIFWLLARLVQCVGLLLVCLLPTRLVLSSRGAAGALGLALLAMVLCTAAVISNSAALPDMDLHIMQLKNVSGAVTLGLAALASVAVALRAREQTGINQVDLLAACLALLLSQIHFNLLHFENTLNLIGPVFSLVSSLFICRALINGTFKVPLAALRQANAALLQNEQQASNILRNAADAIITTDEAHTILFANPAAAAMFASPHESMLGSSFERFIPLRHRHAYHAYIRQFAQVHITCRKAGSAYDDYDVTAQDATGHEFPLEAAISVITEGNERYIILILRDISERKHAQQALASSRADLGRLALSLQQAQESERKRFGRYLTDDLGQILAALRIELSLAVRPTATEPLRQQHLGKMDALLGQSIQSARSFSSSLRPRTLEDGGLYFALQNLCSDFRKEFDIGCRFDANEADLKLDEPRTTALFRIVEQALDNVSLPALASEVLVRLQCQAGQLLLQIEDNGGGIRENDFREAIELGLIDMEERVKAMNGKLSIANEQDAGTRIDISIPL